MSEGECLTVDWFDKGRSDGSYGKPLSLLESYAKACSSVGIVPDSQRYREGRDLGLKTYCTPENVQREGLDGHPYHHVCPAHLDANLYRHYEDGRRVHRAESKITTLYDRSEELERQLSRAEDSKKRQRLRNELRDLDYELRYAREELRAAERRLR